MLNISNESDIGVIYKPESLIHYRTNLDSVVLCFLLNQSDIMIFCFKYFFAEPFTDYINLYIIKMESFFILKILPFDKLNSKCLFNSDALFFSWLLR